MLCADYVIVGAGLSGATFARLLWDAGRDVLVLDRRSHVGGNVHDTMHPSGVRIHTYGPHYFRTGSSRIREFVTRFDAFYRYEPRIVSLVDGEFANWPVVANYIERVAGKNWSPAFTGAPTNFEEASLSLMPAVIYEKFVKGYSEKQWGVLAAELSVQLARRFDVRRDGDTRLSRHIFQGLPRRGYHQWMSAMLDGVPVKLGFDYLAHRTTVHHRKLLIFTGPIDEYFGFALGRLKYRAQQRVHVYLPTTDYCLPCGQVNNPDPSKGAHIRWLEWKHMMDEETARFATGTVVSMETPGTASSPDAFEYPFPDTANARRYAAYARMAAALSDVVIWGRLGDYRYYDMDQAIGRAMQIARSILRH